MIHLVLDSNVVSGHVLLDVHDDTLLFLFLFLQIFLLVICNFFELWLPKKFVFSDFNFLHDKRSILLEEICEKNTKLIYFIYVRLQLSFYFPLRNFVFSISEELCFLNLFLEFLLQFIFLYVDLGLLLPHLALHFQIKLFNWNLASFLNYVGQFNDGSYDSFLHDVENSQQRINSQDSKRNQNTYLKYITIMFSKINGRIIINSLWLINILNDKDN